MAAQQQQQAAIRESVEALASLEYDHDGSGGLPIREDALRLFTDELMSKGELSLYESEFRSAVLTREGCIELRLGSEPAEKELVLVPRCADVLTYSKKLDGGLTTIEGIIYFDDPLLAGEEFDDLLSWLDEAII